MANKVAKMLRPNIETLITQGEKVMTQQSKEIITNAEQQTRQHLDEELTRLIALRKVNKNIRQDEIDTLQTQRKQMLQYLQQATWRLDCLRVIVTNKE